MVQMWTIITQEHFGRNSTQMAQIAAQIAAQMIKMIIEICEASALSALS
jgi:hypothetical protein